MVYFIHSLIILALLLQSFGVPARIYQNSAAPVDAVLSSAFRTDLHPDGAYQVGDLISIDIFAEAMEGQEPPPSNQRKLHARVIYPYQQDLGEAGFADEGAGRQRAFLRWAWDTAGLRPGLYYLEIWVTPDHVSWYQAVRLEPAPDTEAQWETTTTVCCEIHYITGTRAEREIEQLKETIQTQAEKAQDRLGFEIQETIQISLIPRVLGHGGFAAEEITLSYPDINYIGTQIPIVIHHELVHRIDAEMGGDHKPSILVEGLAVYASDGHYKVEPVAERAQALVELGRYIPLRELTDNFYPSQHESGYIEGGALVQYLVGRYGWERFNEFYRDFKDPKDSSPSEAMERGLQRHFDLRFDDLEADFLAYLAENQAGANVKQDVEFTLLYYDLVREYQRSLDPPAYFRQAWLPSGNKMRAESIEADFVKSPQSPANALIEALLARAGEELYASDYQAAGQTLQTVESLLADLNELEAALQKP